ncbi:MAG: hypothetical protein MGU50_20340 [Trichodesmium sp. MAG_R02]|jgi:hypothetical protein|nr:hypothetical protein [Trichodesmium sp. MAG_R02]
MATINNLLNIVFVSYSGFQIDELHHHNQNLVGKLHATSLLWSTNMKTAVGRVGLLLTKRRLRQLIDIPLLMRLRARSRKS